MLKNSEHGNNLGPLMSLSKNPSLGPSVTIATVTQWSRRKFFPLLFYCVQSQDYPNILEWIIVNGSQNHEDFIMLRNYFTTLPDSIKKKLPLLKYCESKKNMIGAYRNHYNKYSEGDIVVCFDDDDYYPPERVSHAVDTLLSSGSLIAACNRTIKHDVDTKLFFSSTDTERLLKKNHPNCTFAYKREYLENHTYDENVTNLEEASFLEGFQIQPVQLDPKKTILHMFHATNTFDKRQLILLSLHNKDVVIKRDHDTTLENFVTKEGKPDTYAISVIKQLYPETRPSPYDIVYYCGGLSIEWNPKEKSLGGSEQAVVKLSEEWVKLGYKVAVYGRIQEQDKQQEKQRTGSIVFNRGTNIIQDTLKHNGVDYYPFNAFRFSDTYNNIILWRAFGTRILKLGCLRASKVFVDLHDFSPKIYRMIEKRSAEINRVFIKSRFHYYLVSAFKNKEQKLDAVTKSSNSCIPIANGIRISDFSRRLISAPRNKYRFCYCSCYTRGLEELLKWTWPLLYSLEPRAELHVYYGMDRAPEDFQKRMKKLLASPGVMDHGRQPLEAIVREKQLSTFHLYYTKTVAEIDCISIRESLVAGCIPIISNTNVFAERHGIKFKHEPNEQGYRRLALYIAGILKYSTGFENYGKKETPETQENYHGFPVSQLSLDLEDISEKMKTSRTIMSWEQVAKEWEKNFKQTVRHQ